MYISAKVDYGVRAMLALATAPADTNVKAETLAASQDLPVRFVENILGELRRAGLVTAHRGAEGGFRLSLPPTEISVADVIRALEGPLADVRGLRPEDARYQGPAERLRDVWVATRAALRLVLEGVSLADIARGTLPDSITTLIADSDAWHRR